MTKFLRLRRVKILRATVPQPKSILSFLVFISFVCPVIGCGDNALEQSDSGNDTKPALSAQDRRYSFVRFVDVTNEAGIHFKQTNGASGEKYLPESYGSGAVFFDYNNDGELDLYVVNGADFPGFQSRVIPTNVLYRNNGDGTFTDVTKSSGVGDAGYGQGCTAADYDNDGDMDLYVSNFGANILYRNNGDGTFTDVTNFAGVGDTSWGTSCAFADYDNDGYVDLYVVNYLDFTLENHKKCTAKGYPVYCGPDSYNGVADVLYRNNGSLTGQAYTFTDVTKSAGVLNPEGKGLGVVLGDYDNDGDLDIYVANDRVRNFLYQNQGNGTFVDVSLLTGAGYNVDGQAEAGMGTAFGDYNRDGFQDIFVTNYQGETNTLYFNEGNGFFSDVALSSGTGGPSLRYLGWGTSFFDYDNDGDLDIFVANGHIDNNIRQFDQIGTYEQPNFLFDNTGSDSENAYIFREISAKLGGEFLKEEVSRGAAFGDYDNDGDIDIFITNINQTPTLLRNDGGNQNNWLMIKTVGTKSNRDGIGARVKVVAGSLSQIKEVKSGSSYLSQNDLRLLFGLGSRTKVDSVVVRWPSGIIQVMENFEVNQILTIIEKFVNKQQLNSSRKAAIKKGGY